MNKKYLGGSFACLLSLLVLVTPSVGQDFPDAPETTGATTKPAPPPAPNASSDGEQEEIERINKWTIGIAGGVFEGAVRFAVDIQQVVDDGDNMRAMPIVSRGSVHNVLDLLYLKGIDIALIHADTFDEYKKQGKIRNIENRIQYISQIQVVSFHLLVRPEVKTIKDLEGKKIGVPGAATAAAALTAKVFARYNVKVEFVHQTTAASLEKMLTGEISGIGLNVAKGQNIFSSNDGKGSFHFLNVDFDKFADDYYVPISFEHNDYPNLIADQEHIETIGVPLVLAVYNWPKGTERHRKVERFIEYYFTRFDKLRSPPFHPQWREINLAAKVPGWKRYWVAEEMLNKLNLNNPVKEKAATAPTAKEKTLFSSMGEEDRRQYEQFLDWKRQQGKK